MNASQWMRIGMTMTSHHFLLFNRRCFAPNPGDDGDKPEEEEDEDMHSYATAAGYQNEPPPDVASLSSGALPGLGAVVHDPLEAAL
jgi:hypothetical protein